MFSNKWDGLSNICHLSGINGKYFPWLLANNSIKTTPFTHQGMHMRETSPTQGFSTRAIHHGYNPADNQGALVPPIHTSATYAFPDVAYGARCFAGEEPGYFYTRIANPTLALLEGR